LTEKAGPSKSHHSFGRVNWVYGFIRRVIKPGRGALEFFKQKYTIFPGAGKLKQLAMNFGVVYRSSVYLY